MEARRTPAKRIVAIGSGKGGVGKSTVSLNTALALAERGDRVGVVDADIYGPNIPLLVNLARPKPAARIFLWRADPIVHEPVERFGIKIMSAGFLIGENQALTWDAGLIQALMHQIVVDVDWGELDYLIVDLPPGTGDVLQLLMREVVLAGVVLVVTPQDIAHLDARKALDAYRRSNANVIGAVENMGPLHCPHCGEHVTVFRPVSEDRSIWSQGVKKLGQIPLDPEVSELGDKGYPVLVAKPDSVYANAFRQAALRLAMELGD